MNKNEQGVVLIEGFGREADPGTGAIGKAAVYLNGALVGLCSRELDEGVGCLDEAATTYHSLAKQCAALMSLPWETRQAHALWAIPYHAEPPATLDEYLEMTRKFYESVTCEDAIVHVMFAAEETDDGRDIVWQTRQMYSLSGGDLAHFAQWYQSAWAAKGEALVEAHLLKSRLLRIWARDGRRDSQESDTARAEMSTSWRAYLTEVWQAEKPMDLIASGTAHA